VPLRLALVCLAFLCVGAAWRAPHALARLGTLAGDSNRLDYGDREVAGGNGIVSNQAALYATRQVIPAGAAYRVVTGPHLRDATSLTVSFAPLYYGYFLMPRRQSEQAHWIVCVGCDLHATSPAARVVWSDGRGISIARAGS
jgi:hypothetical protein